MPSDSALHGDSRRQRRSRLDARVARLAAAQHGVIARAQLIALGLGAAAIDHWLRRGRLHLVHRGVYAVGHGVVSREARFMASVLACGPGAVLSHRSAAELLGIRPDARSRIEVTVPRKLKGRPGIQVHDAEPAADEIATERGIPVTTPHRTILDLASVLPPTRLERCINQIEILRLPDTVSLDAMVDRHHPGRGTAALRKVLAAMQHGGNVTRDELEARFQEALHRWGLPRPEVNARVEGYEVDCLWRAARVIVELDSYTYHATRAAFERDHAKTLALKARGWEVIRVTWGQLHDDEKGVRALLERAIRAGAWPRPCR